VGFVSTVKIRIERYRGHFEIFYFTHLLYLAYFTLLIVHAPRPWHFILMPLTIFLAELLYRCVALREPVAIKSMVF
jgi:hypothetical protein